MIVILLVLFLAKDYIAGMFLTFGVSSFTDLPASLQKVTFGFFDGKIDVKGFKLYNPTREFKDRVMLDIPELYMDCDVGSFLSGTKHLKEVKLNIRELVVVKNVDGELNIDSLKAIQTKGGKKEGSKQDFKFKIDVLEMRVDKVVYKDYSRAGEPVVREFNIGLNERYTNITDPYSFASLVIFKALVNTSIASLANFDLGPLKNAASDALANATETATEAVTGAVSKGAEAVKELLPFGK